MEIIEIRQNKKTVIPMLVLLTATLLGVTYYIYFSGKYDNTNTIKILYFFLTAVLIYAIYMPIKKFIKNEPVLTFSKSEIKINEKGKTNSFSWLEVIDWEMEDDDGTTYLIIKTTDSKRIINISWLDKRPNEIKELLQTFKTK